MSKTKKQKFEQKSKSGFNPILIIAGLAILAIIGVAFINFGGESTPSGPAQGAIIKEVTVAPTATEDTVVIKKSDVEKFQIVRFEYEPIKTTLKSGAQISFPLMAYVLPSGEIRVAVRMCEPCNGLTFSTVGGTVLHCDTCGTEWDMATNKWTGVGASQCGAYAPEAVEYEVVGDDIVIKIDSFKNWVPRA